MQKSIVFLGHVIGPDGVMPGETKVEAIQKFPRPKNIHEVRRFLGLTGFFLKICLQLWWYGPAVNDFDENERRSEIYFA